MDKSIRDKVVFLGRVKIDTGAHTQVQGRLKGRGLNKLANAKDRWHVPLAGRQQEAKTVKKRNCMSLPNAFFKWT